MLGMFLVFALASPLPATESGDSQLFIAGFNAYQREEYGVAVEKLNRVIKEYPGSPFRDMSLFWLACASYRTGDHPEAARVISLFLKEYPDHPLKGTVEDNLLKLAVQHDRGETIARAPGPPPQLEPVAEPPQQDTRTGEPRPHPASIVPTHPEKSAVALAKPAEPAEPAPASAPPAPLSTTPPTMTESVVVSRTVVATASPIVVTPAEPMASPTTAAPQPGVTPPPTVPPPAAASKTEPTAPTEIVSAQTSEATKRDAAVAPASHSAKAFRKGRRGGKDERRRLDLQDRAIAEYRATIELYPGTPAAKEAAARLRKLVAEQRLFDKGMSEFSKGRYRSALASFDRYLKEYPASPRAADATFYRGECFLNLSRR